MGGGAAAGPEAGGPGIGGGAAIGCPIGGGGIIGDGGGGGMAAGPVAPAGRGGAPGGGGGCWPAARFFSPKCSMAPAAMPPSNPIAPIAPPTRPIPGRFSPLDRPMDEPAELIRLPSSRFASNMTPFSSSLCGYCQPSAALSTPHRRLPRLCPVSAVFPPRPVGDSSAARAENAAGQDRSGIAKW